MKNKNSMNYYKARRYNIIIIIAKKKIQQKNKNRNINLINKEIMDNK